MKRLAAISVIILCLIACDTTNHGGIPGLPKAQDFSFITAEIISLDRERGRNILTLRLEDKEANTLNLVAYMVSDYLEGGIYNISTCPGECYQASAEMYIDGEHIQMAGGYLIISRHNDIYRIRADFDSEEAHSYTGNFYGTIYFNAKETPPASEAEKGKEIRDLIFFSEILGREIPYSIYLPENYSEDRKFPVLYALHGMYGDNNDWFRSGKISMNASEVEQLYGTSMIVVSPYAMNSFYCDELKKNLPYKTFFFEEFIPFIENTFSIKQERESRAITGISMGGYGAIYYGLIHPEMFCHVYACSPATYIGNFVPDLEDMLDDLNVQEVPCITIEIGTTDPLIITSGSFVKAMEGKGFAYEYITRDGTHEWPFWKACTPKVVRKAAGYFM